MFSEKELGHTLHVFLIQGHLSFVRDPNDTRPVWERPHPEFYNDTRHPIGFVDNGKISFLSRQWAKLNLHNVQIARNKANVVLFKADDYTTRTPENTAKFGQNSGIVLNTTTGAFTVPVSSPYKITLEVNISTPRQDPNEELLNFTIEYPQERPSLLRQKYDYYFSYRGRRSSFQPPYDGTGPFQTQDANHNDLPEDSPLRQPRPNPPAHTEPPSRVTEKLGSIQPEENAHQTFSTIAEIEKNHPFYFKIDRPRTQHPISLNRYLPLCHQE